MRNNGNDKSNQIFEANLSGYHKPTPDSSREDKETFIRDKYENLKFAAKDKVPTAALQKPTIDSLYKEGYLCDITQTAIGNSTKRRWCVLKLTPSTSKLFFYRNKGVCIILKRLFCKLINFKYSFIGWCPCCCC